MSAAGPGNATRPEAFELLIKPAGAACNLDCAYCFYLGRQALHPQTAEPRMTEATLELFTRQYLAAHAGAEVTFAWQGGEPTLLGLDFFRRAVALQQQHGGGRRIRNTLQTNGTLLTDEWCAFLAGHRVSVGSLTFCRNSSWKPQLSHLYS